MPGIWHKESLGRPPGEVRTELRLGWEGGGGGDRPRKELGEGPPGEGGKR